MLHVCVPSLWISTYQPTLPITLAKKNEKKMFVLNIDNGNGIDLCYVDNYVVSVRISFVSTIVNSADIGIPTPSWFWLVGKKEVILTHLVVM